MSSELRIAYVTGRTIYAHILNSSGQRWNGTAFEDYTSANYSTYDVALTEQGTSAVYVGNFPSSITTRDIYQIIYYRQVGGSPAQGTDTIAGTGDVEWTGSQVASSSVVATLSSLIAEAYKKAGINSPTTAQTARAQNEWIPEILADIWTKVRKSKFLQARAVKVLTKGLGRYANPTDYESDLSMEFATGSRYGALQVGGSSTITLAASDTSQEGDLIGKEIVIISGSALGQIAYITAYNSSTKVATVAPSFTSAPSTDNYLILDSYKPLIETPIWQQKDLRNQTAQGEPEKFFPIGDADDGEFILYPIPFRSDAQPMVVLQRYYVDITEIDLEGTLFATLLQKWRNLWMAGLVAKSLDDEDDDKANAADRKYLIELREIRRAAYANQLVDNQAKVVDY